LRAILGVEYCKHNGKDIWSLGEHNDFLFDTQFKIDFFQQWAGVLCVMDYDTYKIVPDSCKKYRTFIVYSEDLNLVSIETDDEYSIKIVHNLTELFTVLNAYQSIVDKTYEITTICGGKNIYEALLPYCEFLYTINNNVSKCYNFIYHTINVPVYDTMSDTWKNITSQVVTDVYTNEIFMLHRYKNLELKEIPIY
jgi:dihydrofolate reductase